MNISFLLGAGFSVPDKYPSRWDINKKIRAVKFDDIEIYPEGTAAFLNERPPLDENDKLNERHFIEELISYYTTNIIPKTEDFDYESFFDFYQGFINGRYKCYKFDNFIKLFQEKFHCETDTQNLLSQFNNTFNQLIANLISINPPSEPLTKPYQKYSEFLVFIEKIRDSYDKIFIHTLNHDLLLEELSNSDAIQSKISDGFSIQDSPFYSRDAKDKIVQLERFTNDFDYQFCLYKLHGSLDHYIYNFKNIERTTIKLPYGVSHTHLMKEYEDENGELKMDYCIENYYPDFLSGTTEKIKSYSRDYYEPVFEHFNNNLQNSKVLLCIGYGLKDWKINEFIIENFLSDASKTMIVISPSKANSELYNFSNVKYYGENKGVQDIEFDAIHALLK